MINIPTSFYLYNACAVKQCPRCDIFLFQILLGLVMGRMVNRYDNEKLSIVHVHLVYEAMLVEVTSMCSIFNLGVPDRRDKPLYELIKDALDVKCDVKGDGAVVKERESSEETDNASYTNLVGLMYSLSAYFL